MAKNCKIGKSCQSACVNKGYSCRKELTSKANEILTQLREEAKNATSVSEYLKEDSGSDEWQETRDFFNPPGVSSLEEIVTELKSVASEEGLDIEEEGISYIGEIANGDKGKAKSILGDASYIPGPVGLADIKDLMVTLNQEENVKREESLEALERHNSTRKVIEISGKEEVNLKDIIKKGEYLGGGAFGNVYAKGGIAVKGGGIGNAEIKISRIAGELEIGPKVIMASKDKNNRGILVMSRVEGVTLDKYHQRYRRSVTDEFNQKVNDSINRQTGRLLEAGVNHGDLHKGNVIVNNRGEVTIIDYGFAEIDG